MTRDEAMEMAKLLIPNGFHITDVPQRRWVVADLLVAAHKKDAQGEPACSKSGV